MLASRKGGGFFGVFLGGGCRPNKLYVPSRLLER